MLYELICLCFAVNIWSVQAAHALGAMALARRFTAKRTRHPFISRKIVPQPRPSLSLRLRADLF